MTEDEDVGNDPRDINEVADRSMAHEDLTKPRVSRKKVATISSCVLWVLSIILSFTVPSTSSLIWLPDATLLVGFFPLLFVWSPSWPWLVFGVCNLGIGFLLLMFSCIPDDPFPQALRTGKHHLADFHRWEIWILLGGLATTYGGVRLSKNIVHMIIARGKPKRT